jgi:hypothetical protein
MLFGLPFSNLPDDDRDRVDMAVERMMPADVELLQFIVATDRTARPSPEPEPYFFIDTKVVALVRGIEVRIATTDEFEDYGTLFGDKVYEEPQFGVDHAAFGALLSFGLADTGPAKASQGEWQIHRMSITPMGRLVIQAIEEVRAGFDAPGPSG